MTANSNINWHYDEPPGRDEFPDDERVLYAWMIEECPEEPCIGIYSAGSVRQWWVEEYQGKPYAWAPFDPPLPPEGTDG